LENTLEQEVHRMGTTALAAVWALSIVTFSAITAFAVILLAIRWAGDVAHLSAHVTKDYINATTNHLPATYKAIGELRKLLADLRDHTADLDGIKDDMRGALDDLSAAADEALATSIGEADDFHPLGAPLEDLTSLHPDVPPDSVIRLQEGLQE
jgi:hypothetical protein